MRILHLVTLLFIVKYSMENQNKSLLCGAFFSLCGIPEVCGVDLVRYIRSEIRTYQGVCDNILTRRFSPSTYVTSESSLGHVHDVTVISIHKQRTERQNFEI